MFKRAAFPLKMLHSVNSLTNFLHILKSFRFLKTKPSSFERMQKSFGGIGSLLKLQKSLQHRTIHCWVSWVYFSIYFVEPTLISILWQRPEIPSLWVIVVTCLRWSCPDGSKARQTLFIQYISCPRENPMCFTWKSERKESKENSQPPESAHVPYSLI